MATGDPNARASWSGVVARTREALGTAMRAIGRRDVNVAAAQLTYFGGIAIVPWLLLACWSTTWFGGTSASETRLLELQALVPPGMGAREPFRELVRAGVGLGWLGALATLLPATFYGEGIRRGCLSLLPARDRFTGWRARAAILPLLVIAPPLAIASVHLSSTLVDLAARDGVWPHLARIVISFTITWLALALPLAWTYRQVAPGYLPWTSAALGGLATASFLAGFLQGFLLFLSIPVDVGVPFGGLDVVGGTVAAAFWLFLLHLVLLVGWVVTVEVDEELRRPDAEPA
ncbi:YhjD/YihY/BrkB family envelope integrity protein [Aeromicrobium wangtongii]|uniref:YhjD/YihY/BrkB family envelope integrity protein n=1 Tax=Aeromicrobium wangtongii TaxID=2969247 RepID=UPI00201751A7|nr:YhjD/YihY/BrkB family envelope integrity protein [Aeromicrobium wangtongii]MCL3817687.1 YihY/virulence factor BrkB family protein [Aeromicrobium wangtongii]